jgi:hypothetical protein
VTRWWRVLRALLLVDVRVVPDGAGGELLWDARR